MTSTVIASKQYTSKVIVGQKISPDKTEHKMRAKQNIALHGNPTFSNMFLSHLEQQDREAISKVSPDHIIIWYDQ